MKKSLVYLLFFLWVSCAGNTSHNDAGNEIPDDIITIDLTAGFNNTRTVKLSEIADSVTFIPFETNSYCHMGEGQKNIIFSPPYIFYYKMYFDWNGNYCGSIGKRGNGPFEEPEGISQIVYTDNHFYTKGTKFIEYDTTGEPTGKVRKLYTPITPNSSDLKDGEFLLGGMDFSSVGDLFTVYDYPGIVYLFNRDFETVYSKVVTETDSLYFGVQPIGGSKCITYYKDAAVFYNFMNDTVFYITNKGLIPQYVASFEDKLKLSTYTQLNFRKLIGDCLDVIYGGDSVEDTELIKLTKNKHKVTAMYETESYLFFSMTEIILFAEPRNELPAEPYLIYFDKENGKTTRVNKGFVDDLLGMDHFFPLNGIYDEKLITYLWPHELFDFIEECKDKGREVNPQLLALSKKLTPEANPVLILVHLKKNSC